MAQRSQTKRSSKPGRPTSQAALNPVVSFLKKVKLLKERSSLKEFESNAKQALKNGASLLAYDLANIGLGDYPDSLELRRTKGLALARSGATLEAKQLARELYDEGYEDEETLGLLARTLKDQWQLSTDSVQKAESLQEAAALYELAFRRELKSRRRNAGYWTGINAATLAVASGDLAKAITLAEGVRRQCLRLLNRSSRDENHYWILATIGEANLILRQLPDAAEMYGKAAELAYKTRSFGDLCSTYRNARLLLELLRLNEDDRKLILSGFRRPRVVLFAGHMIDRDRPEPRFPEELEGVVRNALREKLKGYGGVVGYSSAACGSDILFLETVKKLGGSTYVVLPYERAAFAKESVEFAGMGWKQRFQKVLREADDVITVSPYQKLARDSVTYDYSNLVLTGLATVYAQHLECELQPLCVWNELAGDGPGGTAAIVRRWQSRNWKVDILNPAKLSPAPKTGLAKPRRTRRARPASVVANSPGQRVLQQSKFLDQMVVKALLFADMKGFSKLAEEQMPAFIEDFFGLVGRLIRRSEDAPVTTEDRGDGVFCVFNTSHQAARFALDLNECVAAANSLKRLKLGEELKVRIGLHAGPVHEFLHPITGKLAYTGTHVSRAARIEPVAPPGHVWASREFAAMSMIEAQGAARPADFTCAYVGLTVWHKDYGVEPTFHVRRRIGSEA
jgi:class 3 adenylate cyclase/tetratricopeptide (TPR) repeat protein